MSDIALFSAFWLGILTAISPCPLATNIAAISFISQKAGKRSQVLYSGMLYALGRTIAYVVLGGLITAGFLKGSESSRFLQKYVNEALGPILILLGLVLLGWIGSGLSITLGTTRIQKMAKDGGTIWAAPIGALFALSFCPVSAGLFFGGLLPLALNQNSMIAIPLMYGLGTSLPVIGFAIILVYATAHVSKVFDKLTSIERWIRAIAGITFILAGLYYCLIYIYGVSL